ncbi:MAG: hypothetical protein KDN18_17650 [Verrucomicrobiae bacterium]|nr:hypothetical protein [Verrucomicrobiae bacterium]
MKLKISLLAGLAALGFASSASAQTVINITGATAFRAAAHTSIINMLGGPGVCQYGYVGSSISSANHAIFVGNIGGNPYVIRTSQSGSTAGIRDVVQGNSLTYLRDNLTSPDISTSGVQIAANIADATTAMKTETDIPRFSFSDVDQAISNNPTPALPGTPVGVVPFIFVANVGAPAALTNMTDQLHEAQWSTGQLPLSMYTGNPADTKLVLNTGRSNGSGTRATILSETQYGPFRAVVQWGGPNTAANITGAEGTGTIAWLQLLNDGGYSSNSYVRQNLSRTSANVTVGTDNTGAGGVAGQDIVMVSYLTLSDAVAISDVNGPGTGVGAKALTYNGAAYSEDNVKNGRYSLWGYQQFYGPIGITQAEQDFFDGFTAEIPNALNPLTTGIKIPEMNVTRNGGDGGPITPN